VTLNAKASLAAAKHLGMLAPKYSPEVTEEFREQVIELDRDPEDRSEEAMALIQGHDLSAETRTMEAWLAEVRDELGVPGDGGDDDAGDDGADGPDGGAAAPDAKAEAAPKAKPAATPARGAADGAAKAAKAGDAPEAKAAAEADGATASGEGEDPDAEGEGEPPVRLRLGQRVKFLHQHEDGVEIEGEGTLHGAGEHGAIVMGDDGTVHKVRPKALAAAHGRAAPKKDAGRPAVPAAAAGGTPQAKRAAKAGAPMRKAEEQDPLLVFAKSDPGGDSIGGVTPVILLGMAVASAADAVVAAAQPAAPGDAMGADPRLPVEAAPTPAEPVAAAAEPVEAEPKEPRLTYMGQALRMLRNAFKPGQ
jgi:hypothetical protein